MFTPTSTEGSALATHPSRPTTDRALNAGRLPYWKRAIDITGAIIGFPVMLLVLALGFFVLKANSTGPLLFRQIRIGQNGRPFGMFKIRTMATSCDCSVHRAYFNELVEAHKPMEKLDTQGDTRLIPGGLFLRASGLDELPQLINVLRGEMTLVGPRPCLPYEFHHYGPQHLERFSLRPGITGLWQVTGKSRTTFEQMVRLDLEYGQMASPLSDLRIILRTFPTILVQIAEFRKRVNINQRTAAKNYDTSAKTAFTVETVSIDNV